MTRRPRGCRRSRKRTEFLRRKKILQEAVAGGKRGRCRMSSRHPCWMCRERLRLLGGRGHPPDIRRGVSATIYLARPTDSRRAWRCMLHLALLLMKNHCVRSRLLITFFRPRYAGCRQRLIAKWTDASPDFLRGWNSVNPVGTGEFRPFEVMQVAGKSPEPATSRGEQCFRE
jgi:hypothetical protein